MEFLVRVDRRGRIVIPSEVRRSLGIGRVVRLRVEEGRVVLETVEDPIEKLVRLVISAPSSEEVVEEQFERMLEEQAEELVGEK
jgi:AbrB family looped-hinge helix DNA binding protein